MNYIDITYPDINNGLGVRATIWFAGCPFHCEGCHNKETWNYNIGHRFDPEYVFNEILILFKERPYLDGITLSGGDPLGARSYTDLELILDFIKMFKEEFPNKNIWIYSGQYYEDMLDDKDNYEVVTNILKKKKQILDNCDILVDGPFDISKRDISLAFRGSTNQRIIDLKTKKILNID